MRWPDGRDIATALTLGMALAKFSVSTLYPDILYLVFLSQFVVYFSCFPPLSTHNSADSASFLVPAESASFLVPADSASFVVSLL